ncbi:hypothetical protein CYMTET_52340 [Cymbomonas tetramitiformis]|uniref:Uncharacterized protein n=1 Tax=Cymbomonas tetramitiformis TaxID=36881 RepID=A0AAE0ERF6_9CHLO|nr:hypothetical protein CYMTET_52340 [Cymbomonas tetramitiformis]
MESQLEMYGGMVHQAPLKGAVSNDSRSNPARVEVPRQAIESSTNRLPDIKSGFSRSLTSAARLIGMNKEPSVVANDPLLLNHSSVSALVQSDPLLFKDDEEEDDDEETETEFDSDEDGPL